MDYIKCYDNTLDMNPEHKEAWFRKGMAIGILGDIEAAIKCHEKALEIDPHFEEARHQKEIMVRFLENSKEKVPKLTSKDRSGPDSMQIKRHYFEKPEEIIKNCEKALLKDPKDKFEWLIKGRALLELNNYEESIKCYDKALDIDPYFEEAKSFRDWGLVPMVKAIKNSGQTGGKKNFIKLLIHLRKKLPNTFIHAFGIGGTMAYLAFLCGVDNIDSNGWILKASRGVIQLLGVSDRFLQKKPHNRPHLFSARKIRGTNKILNEIDLFMRCKCPICLEYHENGKWKKSDWIKKCNDFDQYTKESRMKRVIHNLWLYQNELKLMREAIKHKNMIPFIEKRLEFSIHKNLFQNIVRNILH